MVAGFPTHSTINLIGPSFFPIGGEAEISRDNGTCMLPILREAAICVDCKLGGLLPVTAHGLAPGAVLDVSFEYVLRPLFMSWMRPLYMDFTITFAWLKHSDGLLRYFGREMLPFHDEKRYLFRLDSLAEVRTARDCSYVERNAIQIEFRLSQDVD